MDIGQGHRVTIDENAHSAIFSVIFLPYSQSYPHDLPRMKRQRRTARFF